MDKAKGDLITGSVESKADLKLAKEGLASSIKELEAAKKQLAEMEAIQRQLESSKKRIQMGDGAVRQVENLRALLDETQRQLSNRDMSLSDSQKTIEKLLIDNKSKYNCFVANDNSIGQIVVSGTNENINKLVLDLQNLKIRNIKLPVSAPFHCQLMNKATKIMNDEILKLNVLEPKTPIVSNVTAKEEKDVHKIKKLLVDQIESRVRWRESVLHMINNGVDHFIEIGPGKVLSSMIKRINSSVKISAINNEEDINNLKLI